MSKTAELKARLTPDVLDIFLEAVKVIGWSVDMIETQDFLNEVFEIADLEAPNVDPYEDEEL